MKMKAVPKTNRVLAYIHSWEQFQESEHSYLYDGTLTESSALIFMSTDNCNKLDAYAIIPNMHILNAMALLLRKFELVKDATNYRYALDSVRSWAKDYSELDHLVPVLDRIELCMNNSNSNQSSGFQMSVYDQRRGKSVSVDPIESLKRLYYGKLFHADNKNTVFERKFVIGMVGGEAIEMASALDAMLQKIRPLIALGELLCRSGREPGSFAKFK